MRAVQSSSTARGSESSELSGGRAGQFAALRYVSQHLGPMGQQMDAAAPRLAGNAGVRWGDSLGVQREASALLEAMRFCQRRLMDEEVSAEERLRFAAELGVLRRRSFELMEQFVRALQQRDTGAQARGMVMEPGLAGGIAC
ncbi:hypothetical protein BH10ACI4_BH10ACI4_35250 [soil metagenome]